MPRFTRAGQNFSPQGANHIKIVAGNVVTFDVGGYDGTAIDAIFDAMAGFAVNTVRLWYWPTTAGAVSGAINPAYAANVADGIKRARSHGLVTILSCAGLPTNGGYYPNFATTDTAYNDDVFHANWF